MLHLFYGGFFVKISLHSMYSVLQLSLQQGRRYRRVRGAIPPPSPDFGRYRSKIFSFKMHWINAHPSTKFSDLPTALYRLYRVVDSSSFYSSQRKSSAFFLESYMHSVDITESFSAQYPTWIFNFGPFGQLRAVKENSSITYTKVCYF